MEQFTQYLDKVVSGSKPFWGTLLAVFSYVLFPDKAYMTAAMAVGITILLDILTKYMAISHECHGYKNAVKTRKIYSKTLWEGTRIKLVSYLIVFILAGLSYRVTMLTQVSVFLATVVYSVIFLREAQSIIENLIDAGADLGWLQIWVKKKQKQILEEDLQNNNEMEGKEDIYEQNESDQEL